MKSNEDTISVDLASKLHKGYVSKHEKDMDNSSKVKRTSLQRVKRVNKIPLGKKELGSVNPNRSTSRGKQLSAKNRLVYK